MASTHLGNALILGVVIHHVASMGMLSRPPGCLATIDACIPDLCRSSAQPAVMGAARCGTEGCQIKGLEVCNMSTRAVVELFPSLERCVCVWVEEEEEVGRCLALQALTTQCHQDPALRKRRAASDMDWKSSGLIAIASDGGGGRRCFERMALCLGDTVCNRNLGPLLQACDVEPCNRTRCRGAALRFYGGMPVAVADLLVMCECEPQEDNCPRMATALHSGTCGDDIWSCQEGVNHCLRDGSCRNRLNSFILKCWDAESMPCEEDEECITQMNPALLLGGEAECRAAFLALLGTPLRYPCSCTGQDADERQRCDTLSDILHNRSHFVGPWQKLADSYKTSNIKEPKSEGHTLVTGHLLYAVIYAVLIVTILSVTTVLLCRAGALRKTSQTQFTPLGKAHV